MKEKILVAGSGAMATLFAARLSKSGYPVGILGSWKAGLSAFEKKGACLVDTEGVKRFYPVEVLSPEKPNKKSRYALVLVKSWQTCQAASRLGDWLDPDGLCLTLQNGLGNRECLEEYLGPDRVAIGVTTSGGTLMEPGCVMPGGVGSINMEKHPGVKPLVEIFQDALFDVKLVRDATSLVWGKLAINAAINPLSAILRLKNGDLLENEHAAELMDNLALETSAVAEGMGVRLPYDDPVKAARDVARRTASNNSSMLQDVLRNARTEIESINGAVWKLGRKLNIPTPLNELMTRLVRAITTTTPNQNN